MDRLEYFISVLEYTLQNPNKKHLVGGILVSMSMLFAGLAITAITISNDDDSEQKEQPLI